jgi:hypothetical protein
MRSAVLPVVQSNLINEFNRTIPYYKLYFIPLGNNNTIQQATIIQSNKHQDSYWHDSLLLVYYLDNESLVEFEHLRTFSTFKKPQMYKGHNRWAIIICALVPNECRCPIYTFFEAKFNWISHVYEMKITFHMWWWKQSWETETTPLETETTPWETETTT